jgi:PadR family transcriptional regulator PadR
MAKIDLLQGTLDMLILKTLRLGAQHGYGIGQAIRAGSGEVLYIRRCIGWKSRGG